MLCDDCVHRFECCGPPEDRDDFECEWSLPEVIEGCLVQDTPPEVQ